MFIKFSGFRPHTATTGPISEIMVECKSFCKSFSTDREVIYIHPDDKAAYELFDQDGRWRTAYIMNNEGKTIETIVAPLLAELDKA